MNDSIYTKAEELAHRFGSRDPYLLLEALNTTVDFTHEFRRDGLKGFCVILNKQRYVVINGYLCDEEARVVAAHEAGHIVLHRNELKMSPFHDDNIYLSKSRTEREANFFAADFLISDKDVLDAMNGYDANFFSVARALCIPEQFFAFKLYSMVERGYSMKMPVELDSTFLAR